MTAYVPTLVLVKAEHIATINAVMAVLQSGTRELIAKLADKDAPTVLTHYFMSDFSATQAHVDEWSAMCSGVMPAITGEWGVGGVPDINDAIAACADENMLVFPGYGVVDAGPFIAGMKAGYDLVTLEEPL